MDPLTLAILANIAAPAAGGLANRLFGGDFEVPDFIRPALQEAADALRISQEFGQTQSAQLEGELAAQGVSNFAGGTMAREAVARRVGDVFARSRATALDAITRARQQQAQIETQMHNQEVAQRRQAIQNVASGVGSVLNLKALGFFNGTTSDAETTTNTIQGVTPPELPMSAFEIPPGLKPDAAQRIDTANRGFVNSLNTGSYPWNPLSRQEPQTLPNQFGGNDLPSQLLFNAFNNLF